MRELVMKNFKTETYKDIDVYIRTFGFYFEFLFVFKGKIHTSFHRVQPDLWHHVLYFLRLRQTPYSDEQMNKSKLAIFQIAEQVIDHLYFQK